MNAPQYPERGWLLPYLLLLDGVKATRNDYPTDLSKKQLAKIGPLPYSGPCRWMYWSWICEHVDLPAAPIPQLHFTAAPQHVDMRHIQECLRYPVRRHWQWYDEAWIFMVKWLLHGFGRRDLEDEVARIPEDVREQWYRFFNLAHLLHSPCDWSAFILQGGLQDDKRTKSPWASTTGFYSTPMPVIKLMSDVTMGEADPLIDQRLVSVHDCCCGSGSILLEASNRSLRLSGQDIVHSLCLCAELNGYLFAPWLVIMPNNVREMLDHKYKQMMAVVRMRDLLRGDVWAMPDIQEAPVGIEVSTDTATAERAVERAVKAASFWEHVQAGEIEQMSMF